MPKGQKQETEPLPELAVSQDEAQKRISDRIRIGEEIKGRSIAAPDALKTAQEEYYRWDSFNAEMLERLFTTGKFASEYRFFGVAMIGGPQLFAKDVSEFLEDVSSKIHRLASIRDRLPLIPVSPIALSMKKEIKYRDSSTRQIFIVHGHDSASRESAARFLERLDLEPVILHEQAGRGRTIIEKLEGYSDVDFAVILLTSDDVGAPKSETGNLRPRSRQNVILELGYFVGKLGRDRVCALYQDGVELPSDFLGVQYVELRTGWEIELARELRAAGMQIDMNKVVR